jgi:hypothetical protein
LKRWEGDPDAFERRRGGADRKQIGRSFVRNSVHSNQDRTYVRVLIAALRSVFMEDVRLHSEKGRLVDPLDGSIENAAAVENYGHQEIVSEKTDQLMTATTVLMNGYIIDISDDWMEIVPGIRVQPSILQTRE